MDEKRYQIYSEVRKDLLNRQLSNSQNADRAILTLSVAGLGFLFTFFKYFLYDNRIPLFFYVSSLLFLVAIFSTLLSFITSQKAINKQLEFAKEYYLNENEEYLSKKNWLSNVTNLLFYVSIFTFLTAIITTSIFFKIQFGGIT